MILWEFDFAPLEGRISGVRIQAASEIEACVEIKRAYPDREVTDIRQQRVDAFAIRRAMARDRAERAAAQAAQLLHVSDDAE